MRRTGKPHSKISPAIASEIENCRAAWQWAVLHDKLHWAQRALPTLGNYYLLHGPFQEGSNLMLTAIEELHDRRRGGAVANGEHNQLLVELLAVQAKLYNRQAAYEDACAEPVWPPSICRQRQRQSAPKLKVTWPRLRRIDFWATTRRRTVMPKRHWRWHDSID